MNQAKLRVDYSLGFTLVELMVTVAILGILTAIAVPLMSGYISSSHKGVMKNNIQSVSLFERNYHSFHQTYISGTYDPANPGATDGLKKRIGWEPNTDKNTIVYVVTCEVPNSDSTIPKCDSSGGYYVTATDSDGTKVCTAFAGAACP